MSFDNLFDMASNLNEYRKDYTRVINSDNAFGIASELASRRQNSNLDGISAIDKADTYVSVRFTRDDGTVYTIPVPAENKTNGGRINHLFDNKAHNRFVLYEMDICNACTNGIRRRVKKRIIPLKLFLTVLEQTKAYKKVNHDGITDGIAIQVSSKKLFTWLSDYPILFDNQTIYKATDFNNLYDYNGNLYTDGI